MTEEKKPLSRSEKEAKEVHDIIERLRFHQAPEVAQGVSFFNKMRDLVTTGFFTSEIGVKDLGYMGNTPNQWKGVPDEVLKQYGYAYTDKELKECI